MEWLLQQAPALIAAAVAVGAAWSARNSARGIAGLAHKVAGVDRSGDALREVFRTFIQSLSVDDPVHLAQGRILAASEVLRANPLPSQRA